MSERFKCNFCILTFKGRWARYYHTNLHHPERMKRAYHRHSSDNSLTLINNSSDSSARPLPLLDAPLPAIVGNKRHHYENQEENLDVVEISSKDLKKKETVQKLLATAEESYSNGYTYHGVYHALTDKENSQDTITLRPIFSEMQNKRLHKKILAEDEMNKINFNDMSVEAKTYGNHIFHIGEDLTTYDHKQRKAYRRHLEFERTCLDSLLKRVAVELDEISDKTLAIARFILSWRTSFRPHRLFDCTACA